MYQYITLKMKIMLSQNLLKLKDISFPTKVLQSDNSTIKITRKKFLKDFYNNK